jgi:hypothetical protein
VPQTVPCPTCVRLNAAHRTHCLYCGAEMPDPAPAPTRPSREVPANLDALIRKAMKDGSTHKLKSALADTGALESVQPPPAAREALRPPEPTGPRPGAGEVIRPPRQEEARPPTDVFESIAERVATMDAPFEVPPDLFEPLEDDPVTEDAPAPVEIPDAAPEQERPDAETSLMRLWDQADQARQRWLEGDLQSARAALEELELALEQARAALPPPETWEVHLPVYQKPFALVIAGQLGVDRMEELADALELDLATARLQVASQWSRVALRAGDRAPLERLARKARAVGIGATVVGRDDLLEVPAALWLIGRLESGRWMVCARPPERVDPDAAQAAGTLEVESGPFRLAVPGDVVIRRYKGRTSSRWSRQDGGVQDLGERRVSVLDLYGEGPPLRLTVGVTHFEGLPGYEPSSGPRSMKNLLQQLDTIWPEIHVEGRRVCAPTKTGDAGGEGDDAGVQELSGWPLWEEHSRSCWLRSQPWG